MLFVGPAQLRGLDARALDDLLERREAVIAFGAGEVRGLAAAALLFADFAILETAAVLHLDCTEAWAGAAWRLGRAALPLYLEGAQAFPADLARAKGLCDDVTAEDPSAWFEGWSRNRSSVALDTAAVLIRSRGGDSLERAAFARLFALGEPQEGLRAFLGKRAPQW